MLDFLANNTGLLAGGSGAAVLLWMLKKVPNAEICVWVEGTCRVLGKCMTLGLSKWKFTKGFWNKTIEPWFIDLVDNFVGGAVRGFVKGLRSDK
jgi:hypothetical protein